MTDHAKPLKAIAEKHAINLRWPPGPLSDYGYLPFDSALAALQEAHALGRREGIEEAAGLAERNAGMTAYEYADAIRAMPDIQSAIDTFERDVARIGEPYRDILLDIENATFEWTGQHINAEMFARTVHEIMHRFTEFEFDAKSS